MCRARCSLLVKLKWHGGNSVQKKRWPFFFFEADFESPFTLSSSEPSRPSSSAPPISTSCEPPDLEEICESSRTKGCLAAVVVSSRAGVKGEVGRGRWPARPPKLLRVGVFAEGSSARASSAGLLSVKKLLFGRGVVGVVSSPGRPRGGSGTARAVLTAWKVAMSRVRWGRISPTGRRYRWWVSWSRRKVRCGSRAATCSGCGGYRPLSGWLGEVDGEEGVNIAEPHEVRPCAGGALA